MQDDELTRILRSAKAELPPPTLAPAELASRVHAAHRKQQRRRRALIAGVPVVAAVAVLGWRLTLDATHSPIATPSQQVAAVSEAEIANLEAEAAAHAQAARLLIATQPRRSALLADDPLADINEQINIVAYRMVLEADSKQAEMQPAAEAIEIYNRVLELFPTSHSAELARQRLSQTTTSQGESS
jgi:hypothetical protein